MMWVCRPGQQGKYYNLFLSTERIYLAWDGYHRDFSGLATRNEFRDAVVEEKHPEARTTISNWSGQLYSFCVEMNVGDYVLIPSKGSQTYLLCILTGRYEFDATSELPHSRKIGIITKAIPREKFPQPIQYSLGAFRTVFKVKQEREIILIAKQFANETEVAL